LVCRLEIVWGTQWRRFIRVPRLLVGLMPKLIVPSVGSVILFPEFMGSLPDLLFCWFGHASSATLKHSLPWGASWGIKGEAAQAMASKAWLGTPIRS
jgi:hypothetical protein